MTKEDVKRLFSFISKAYKNKKAPFDDEDVFAWFYVLEPYDYETAREAVAKHIRNAKGFPNVADIAAQLPSVAPAKLSEPEGTSWRMTEADAINNFRTYAMIVGVTFPDCRTAKEALAWFNEARGKVRCEAW